MAWYRIGVRLSFGPKMAQLLTRICVTRRRWVKKSNVTLWNDKWNDVWDFSGRMWLEQLYFKMNSVKLDFLSILSYPLFYHTRQNNEHEYTDFMGWYRGDIHYETIGPLLWRHNGRDGVSNHQPHDCLLNRLFRRRWKKTSNLCVTGLCEGNSPGTGEFPAQRASIGEMLPFDDVIMLWDMQRHFKYVIVKHHIIQGWFWVCAQPMWDGVTL